MASPRSNSSGSSRKDLDRPWEPGDSIPAAEAVLRETDSAWALFNEVARQHEARFADTAPLTVPPPQLSAEERGWASTVPAGSLPAAATLPLTRREAQPLFTLEGAMLVARRNNRVCPRPERWSALTALLPARRTLRGMQQPPAPATGAAWKATPALTKRLCFREQVEWAEREGVLESVMDFLQNMSEDQWLHMGED